MPMDRVDTPWLFSVAAAVALLTQGAFYDLTLATCYRNVPMPCWHRLVTCTSASQKLNLVKAFEFVITQGNSMV